MQVKQIDITEMSNREIENLCHMCEVELQERRLAQEEIYKDAMTNGVTIGEATVDRQGYHDYLKDNMEQHPAAAKLIEEYYNDEQYKSAIRNEGA